MRLFQIQLVRRRPAFTLIEMLVVIALAAVLATIVIVKLGASWQAARLEDLAARIANYDRLTRHYARTFGRPQRLIFDLGAGTIRRAAANEDAAADLRDDAVLHLPNGALKTIVTSGESATIGTVAVDCSTNGQTPSYAIRLNGPKGETYWMLTVGLTGRTLRLNNEGEVQDIFHALASGATALASAGNDAR